LPRRERDLLRMIPLAPKLQHHDERDRAGESGRDWNDAPKTKAV
jgi:hypothetical protein